MPAQSRRQFERWLRGREEYRDAERTPTANLLTLRYESLQTNTAYELDRVLNFMGFEPTTEELIECLCFRSFENMRRLEQENTFFLGGRRMRTVAASGRDVHRVRRGKAGGWRDYFNSDQVEQIQSMIDHRLEPGFGYRSDECFTRHVSKRA